LRNRLGTGREVTLADVAEYAGVSASTASRALNGRGELSEQTRAAVREAAAALRFEPSQLARSLRTRTTSTVGFVVPDVSSPFYAAALKGAQRTLEQSGFRVLLMDSGQTADGEVAALRTLLAHRVDGLLVSTVGIERDRFEALVGGRATPCVFFDSAVTGSGAGCVLLDNKAGIELLVDHVLSHGHRRVGLLAGSLRETSGRDRVDAFLAALRRHGISTPDEYIAGDRWTQANGDLATRWILTTDPRPTALISSSVELALGALLACRDLGVRIPDELALATFDDAYFAELLDPPLTAVAYDPADVGHRAAELLVEAIRDPDSGPRRITVEVALVPRRSCGCAR
jgi:LacI family transcriptional regulator, galactose operon repressor